MLTKNYCLFVIGWQHVFTCATALAMNCAICSLIFNLSSSCVSLCCSNTLETPCQTDNQFYSNTLLGTHITKYQYQHKLHNKTIPFKSTLPVVSSWIQWVLLTVLKLSKSAYLLAHLTCNLINLSSTNNTIKHAVLITQSNMSSGLLATLSADVGHDFLSTIT